MMKADPDFLSSDPPVSAGKRTLLSRTLWIRASPSSLDSISVLCCSNLVFLFYAQDCCLWISRFHRSHHLKQKFMGMHTSLN